MKRAGTSAAAIDFGGTLTDIFVRARPSQDRVEGGIALTLPDRSAVEAHVARPDRAAVERLLAGVGLELAEIELLAVTGGRSHELPEMMAGVPVAHVGETEASARGALDGFSIRPAVVLSLGTGTGVVLVPETGAPQRLVGSGIGGGTLLGLARMLLGTIDVAEIGRLATIGDLTRCDLTVGDILGRGIGPIPPEATAAHFARLARPDGAEPRREDLAAALVNLIAQVIVRLGLEAMLVHRARALALVGHVLDVPGFREAFSRVPMLGPEALYVPEAPGAAVARGALAVALEARATTP